MENKVELIIKRMEKLINDDNSFGAYEEYSMLIDETYKEGLNDGVLYGKLEIAKKLIDRKLDVNEIIKITGLNRERIIRFTNN